VIPALFIKRMSMQPELKNQRVNVPLGTGAGNGGGACCADCAGSAG
jgi:hypothetical protein